MVKIKIIRPIWRKSVGEVMEVENNMADFAVKRNRAEYVIEEIPQKKAEITDYKNKVKPEVKNIDSVKQEVKPEVKQQVENDVKPEANLSVEIQPTVKQEVKLEVTQEDVEYVKQQYECGVQIEVIKEKMRRKGKTISIKQIETIIEQEYNDPEFEFEIDKLEYNSKTEVKQEVETDFEGCVIRYKNTEFYCNDVKLYNEFELLKEKGERVYFTFCVSEEDRTASLN